MLIEDILMLNLLSKFFLQALGIFLQMPTMSKPNNKPYDEDGRSLPPLPKLRPRPGLKPPVRFPPRRSALQINAIGSNDNIFTEKVVSDDIEGGSKKGIGCAMHF